MGIPGLTVGCMQRPSHAFRQGRYRWGGCIRLFFRKLAGLANQPISDSDLDVEYGALGSRRIDCIAARGAASNREIANQR
jgi:hypothetical protein